METIEQFHSLMDSLDAIVYVADMDTYEVLFINSYGRDLLGDITGQICWKSLQKGQSGPCTFCTNKYLLNEDGSPGEVYTWEFRNTVTDRWYLIKDRAMEWHDGRIVRLEIATDITERKQAEERLRESEEKFRAIVETTSEWIWSCDTRGVHTYSNNSIRDMLGYEPEEMIGRSAFDLIHPDDVPRAALHIKDAIADRQGWSGLVLRWRHKDGTYRSFESTASPIIGADGSLLGWNGADRDVTERKVAEEKLRESEEEYRDLFESASDMIQIVLPDGKLHYVNPSWRRTFGYSAEEAANLSVFDLIAEDCAGHCQETFSRVLAEGAVDHFETAFLSKDGRRILIEGSATCRYEDGTPLYSRCFLRDVTERETAKQKLAEEKRLSDALVNSLPGHFFLVDSAGRLCRWNRNVELFTGFTSEEIDGMDAMDFFEAGDRETLAGKMRECFEKGEVSTEASLLGKDGRKAPFLYRATRIEMEGEPFIAGLGMDISDLKEVEEKLYRSEKYLGSIIRNEPECVKLMDPNGTVLEMNPAGLAMLEADSPEQVVGQNILDVIDPSHRDAFINLSKKVCRGDKCSLEFQVVGLKGTRRWLETHSVPFSDETTGRTLILAVTRDMTERKKAEEELREAKGNLELQYEKLRKLDIIKDGLLRDVSHELKTPVAKYAMQLEILKPVLEKHRLSEGEKKALTVMEESLRRQEGVIKNLLDLSRLEGGGRKFRLESLPLDRLIGEVREDYRHLLEQHGAEIAVDVPSMTILSDGEMLWHLFSNLFSNAIKFRKEEGPLRISVSAEVAGGNVTVHVADEGRGFSQEEKDQAFERFYQSTASSEGSGVGLAICKMIVDGLGGSITIHSDGKDRGAVVSVTLPTG